MSPKARARPEPKRRRRGRPEASFSARSQILLGAAQAFGERGFSDASVEHVLQAAGVSRRTFYRFFKSKDELFEELYDAASMLFIQSVQNAIALGTTPEEKLSNCLELYLRAPQNVGPVFQVMQIESSRPGTKLYARRQAVFDHLIDVLDENVRTQTGRSVDPLVLRGVIGAAERIALHVFNEAPGDDAALTRAKAAMLHIAGQALADDDNPPPEAP